MLFATNDKIILKDKIVWPLEAELLLNVKNDDFPLQNFVRWNFSAFDISTVWNFIELIILVSN